MASLIIVLMAVHFLEAYGKLEFRVIMPPGASRPRPPSPKSAKQSVPRSQCTWLLLWLLPGCPPFPDAPSSLALVLPHMLLVRLC